jgi:murein L,D-transpeptidase YafK
MQAAEDDPHHSFWKTLQPAYLKFEARHQPPGLKIIGGVYEVD